MEKQSYLKPFMVMEKFLPQEFVAGCDIPGKYCFSSLSSSNRVYLETTGDNQLNQKTGGDAYVEGGAIYFDDYSSSYINGSGSYYLYTLATPKYKIIYNGNIVNDSYHITNTGIFYRSGNNRPTTVEKNFS
jgi:hypothetical protein